MLELISTLTTTAPLIHRVPTPGGMLKRAKYIARGLAYPHSSGEWFHFLQQRELEVVVSHHPCIYHKLQRPYLACTLNTTQRLEALKQHYRFVLANLSPEIMALVYTPPGLKIASFTLRDMGEFELRLGFSRKEKEGDFAIGLRTAGSAKDLYTLSFSVWKFDPGPKEIFIGGLQGSWMTDKETVIDLTRALHGLRPKALLVFAVQQLAKYWEISSVRAVSDTTHIYRHFQKRKTLATTYDPFWTECGGKLVGDGMFDLPVAFVPRDISTLKVNKRPMYRRRYEMLSNFSDQIRTSLGRR